MFLIIFDYLDVRSISRLEACCIPLRDMVVQTSIYKRKLRSISGRSETDEVMVDKIRQEEFVEEEHSKIENSRHYKKKISEYYLRYLYLSHLSYIWSSS